MHNIIYNFYILPLRVFFERVKPRNAEEDIRFSYYFFGFGMVHFLVLFMRFYYLMLLSFNLKDNPALLCVCGLTFIMAFLVGGLYIGRYYIRNYNLTSGQIKSRTLLFAGIIIYCEPIVFCVFGFLWLFYKS